METKQGHVRVVSFAYCLIGVVSFTYYLVRDSYIPFGFFFLAYPLQLTVFSFFSSAYPLQLTIFSLLSSAYCLQLYFLQLTVFSFTVFSLLCPRCSCQTLGGAVDFATRLSLMSEVDNLVMSVAFCFVMG